MRFRSEYGGKLTSELSHMGEGVLQSVRQLEGVHVVEPVLDMAVHQQLGHAQNLAAQMERVAESALLTLLRGERLHRLQVEVVVQVKVVQILPAKENSNMKLFKKSTFENLCNF